MISETGHYKHVSSLANTVSGIIKERAEKKVKKPRVSLRHLLDYTTEEMHEHPRLWRIWRSMFQRCYGTHNLGHYYADVRIDKTWFRFINFLTWAVTHGYYPSLQIDRINPRGHYTLKNCRWVNKKTQMRNTRKAVKVEWEGKSRPLIEVCEALDVPYGRAYNRIKTYGWSVEAALLKPPMKHNHGQ